MTQLKSWFSSTTRNTWSTRGTWAREIAPHRKDANAAAIPHVIPFVKSISSKTHYRHGSALSNVPPNLLLRLAFFSQLRRCVHRVPGAVREILAERLLRMLLKITFQAAQSPTIVEAIIFHLLVRFFLGFPFVIHLVKAGDEHGAIAAQVAMNVDGMIAPVAQKTENGVDVLFGWLHWRSADCAGEQGHAVFLRSLFLPVVEPRENFQLHDVLDAFFLQKFVVGVGFWFRSFVDAVVQFLKADQVCTRRGVNAPNALSIVSYR